MHELCVVSCLALFSLCQIRSHVSNGSVIACDRGWHCARAQSQPQIWNYKAHGFGTCLEHCSVPRHACFSSRDPVSLQIPCPHHRAPVNNQPDT